METISIFIMERDRHLRNMLQQLIAGDRDLAVAGVESPQQNGTLEELFRTTRPDLLLLGIDRVDSEEMTLFKTVREQYPDLPVIILTPHNSDGGRAALEALKFGAVEYILKTLKQSPTNLPQEHFERRLLPVIKVIPRINRKVLANRKPVDEALAKIKRVSSDYISDNTYPVNLLVIAGCLGGVPALYLLLSTLPENLPVPIVVVQHMPEIYTGILAEDLAKVSRIDVSEVNGGEELVPGTVYIAKGGYHVKAKQHNGKNILTQHHTPEVKGFRPSIDVFLKSVRSLYGKQILVAYLSGGGRDGIEGAEMIDIAGGEVLVQNKHTSLLWDLPLKITIRGIEEGRYPLERLGHEITRRL